MKCTYLFFYSKYSIANKRNVISLLCLCLYFTTKDITVDSNNYPLVPYVPGDVSEPRYRDHSYEELSKNRFNEGFMPNDLPLSNGFPRSREDFSREEPRQQDLKEAVTQQYEEHRKMISQSYVSGEKPKKKREKRLLTPVIQAIKNFDLAKVGIHLNVLNFSCKKI